MRNSMTSALFLMGLCFGLSGCGGGPADTAESFLSHVAAGEVTRAKTFATESTGKLLDMASGLGGLDVDPDFEFELVEEAVDGNKATIRYRERKDGAVKTIELVKLNDEWKVHQDKG